MKQTYTIRFNKHTHESLKFAAASEKKTISEYLEEIVMKHLNITKEDVTPQSFPVNTEDESELNTDDVVVNQATRDEVLDHVVDEMPTIAETSGGIIEEEPTQFY